MRRSAAILGILKIGSAYVPASIPPIPRSACIFSRRTAALQNVVADIESREVLTAAGLGSLTYWESPMGTPAEHHHHRSGP